MGRWDEERVWEDDIQSKRTSNFNRLARELDDYATDGSGGTAYVPKDMCRMGCAVALVKASSNDAGKLLIDDNGIKMSEVPGKQTVPRAELYAYVNAKRSAQGTEHVNKSVWSDSMYGIKGATRAT